MIPQVQYFFETQPLSSCNILEDFLVFEISPNNFKKFFYRLFENCLLGYNNSVDQEPVQKYQISSRNLFYYRKIKENAFLFKIKFENNSLINLYTNKEEIYNNWLNQLRRLMYQPQQSLISNYKIIKQFSQQMQGQMYLISKNQLQQNNSQQYPIPSATSQQQGVSGTFDPSDMSPLENSEYFALKITNILGKTLDTEILILREIKHPNIVYLQESFIGKECFFMVYEFFKGGSLLDRFVDYDCSIPFDRVKSIIKQILEGLQYLHKNNIVHRDVKLENIMFKQPEQWDLILIDFNLSAKLSQNLKTLYQQCGSMGYVAPEVFTQEGYNSKVDIFSAGVVLYILITGNRLFEGEENLFEENQNCEIDQKLQELNTLENYQQDCIDLLKKMLNKDQHQRYSADECLNHIWFQEQQEEEKDNLNQKNLNFQDQQESSPVDTLSQLLQNTL